MRLGFRFCFAASFKQLLSLACSLSSVFVFVKVALGDVSERPLERNMQTRHSDQKYCNALYWLYKS